jgi:hypothetical protein
MLDLMLNKVLNRMGRGQSRWSTLAPALPCLEAKIWRGLLYTCNTKIVGRKSIGSMRAARVVKAQANTQGGLFPSNVHGPRRSAHQLNALARRLGLARTDGGRSAVHGPTLRLFLASPGAPDRSVSAGAAPTKVTPTT